MSTDRYTLDVRRDDRTGDRLDYVVCDGDEVVARFRNRFDATAYTAFRNEENEIERRRHR